MKTHGISRAKKMMGSKLGREDGRRRRRSQDKMSECGLGYGFVHFLRVIE